MNRDKAIEWLQQGLIIKHKYFFDGESIRLVHDKILTEDDYDFTNTFWKNPLFESGWSVVL